MAGVQLAGMKEQVPALRMTGLHEAFRETVAVDHVDLTVPSGSFFGLVGPNGAGKTTALLMAVGLLRPDAGAFGSSRRRCAGRPDARQTADGRPS